MNLLAHLETFVRIVESGSLSGAAKALGLSLSAVSRQLRSLEEELGVMLLVRSTRRLSVTDDGRQWYERGAVSCASSRTRAV
jgi:DNA-binding transcriptional LysR family regulator